MVRGSDTKPGALEDMPDLGIRATAVLLGALTLVGFWTRLSGLGERPLALDEYYFVKSVQNIMEYGVPRFYSGGYYFRGILLQYLTALSIWVFGEGGFAYRLPTALFGVATLVMAYWLGRLFLSRSWSIVLVAMLTFSSWQIEFSRFARMYAAFQFFSVCFFWSLYRYSFDGKSGKRYLAAGFALMGILSHELGLFLAPFLFLPFPRWFNRDFRLRLREQWVYIGISGIVLAIGLFQTRWGFRYMGVPDRLPPDFISPVLRRSPWSTFGTGLFGETEFILMAVLAVACLAGWYTVYAVRNRSKTGGEELFLGGLMVLAVSCAVFYQFALSVLILAVVILREGKLLVKRPYSYLLALLAVIVIFWFIVLFLNQEWIETTGLGNVTRRYLRSIRLAFFAFPDLYLPVVNAWVEALPFLSLFLGGALAGEIIHIRKLALGSIVANPVVPIVITVIAFGVQPPLQGSTRYILFLYPLALCAGLLSASRLGEIVKRRLLGSQSLSKISATAFCLIVFAASEDFQAFQLSHVNADTVAFRTGKYEKFEGHWYPRWDFQRPAELVNQSASETSRVIVSCSVHTVNAYLRRESAIYWPWEDWRFKFISRERGTRELWSNKRLLSTAEDLIRYTKNSESVWLVVSAKSDRLRMDPEELWPGRVKNVEVFVPGRDKRIEVWKIELGKQESAEGIADRS